MRSGDMFMVTRDGGKTSKSEDQRKQQLPLLDFIVSALRKSMVSTCRQDQGVISAVRHMEIGWPTNVKHLTHDRFHGFMGLPLEFKVQIPCASANVCRISPDSDRNTIPTILLLMQQKLYALGGLKAEGIFRINPENSQEEHVRDLLNKGIVPDEIDVHCLAGLIKAWFRELPFGVLDGLSAQQVLQCDTEEKSVELINQLKPTETCLLRWAIDLMADVVEDEKFNKMNARNIAMVFAPNMTKMSDPLTALMHAVQVTNLLKTLITRRLREREEIDRGCSSDVSDRQKEGSETASDDEELAQYSPTSEDKYESESLSDIEYCFSRPLDEKEDANDGFRRQLEKILCRDNASPSGCSTFNTDSCVSFSESRSDEDE